MLVCVRHCQTKEFVLLHLEAVRQGTVMRDHLFCRLAFLYLQFLPFLQFFPFHFQYHQMALSRFMGIGVDLATPKSVYLVLQAALFIALFLTLLTIWTGVATGMIIATLRMGATIFVGGGNASVQCVI